MARVSSAFEFEPQSVTDRPEPSLPFGRAANDASGAADTVATPAVGDWRTAIADAMARLAASERRTFEALERLARRVAALEQDVAALRRQSDDSRIRALEKQVVELGGRLTPLEDRIAHLGRRR